MTTATRLEALPDYRPWRFRAGLRASTWFGIGAPKDTPAGIVEKLNKEINAASPIPRSRRGMADLGDASMPGSPADFGKLIADETEKWAKVIRAANIKAE